MALNINGTTGISGVDGSASAPALTGTDANTGINFGSDVIDLSTGGSSRFKVGAAGQLGVAGANYGSSGQALLSQGASAAPQWGTLSAGITEADCWRMTANLQGTSSATTITTNLTRGSDGTYIGTGMSESSGVFTFTSTGIYHVLANIQFYLNGDNQYTGVEIAATANNSSYGARAVNYSHIKNVSNPTYSFVHCNAMFDITDTTNQKVRFRVVATSSSTTIVAATDYDHTFFRFIRLGDT